MAKKVQIDLLINAANSAKTVGDLKKAIKDLKSAAVEAGEGSIEFNKYITAAGEAKDKMDQLNESVEALAGGNKIELLSKGFAGLAGSAAKGVQAFVGAQELFGIQNESVLEGLKKIQAASAMADGIEGFAKIGDSVGRFKSVLSGLMGVQKASNVVNQIAVATETEKVVATEASEIATAGQVVATEGATVAQEELNVAMESNPIGLVVVAIVALVAAAVALYEIFSTNTDESERMTKALVEYDKQAKIVKTTDDAQIGLMESKIGLMRAQKKPAAEIAKAQAELNALKRKEIEANVTHLKMQAAILKRQYDEAAGTETMTEAMSGYVVEYYKMINPELAKQMEAGAKALRDGRLKEVKDKLDQATADAKAAETSLEAFDLNVKAELLSFAEGSAKKVEIKKEEVKEILKIVDQASIDKANKEKEDEKKADDAYSQWEKLKIDKLNETVAGKLEIAKTERDRQLQINQEGFDTGQVSAVVYYEAMAQINKEYNDKVVSSDEEASKKRIDSEKAVVDAKLAFSDQMLGAAEDSLGSLSSLFKQGSAMSKAAGLAEIAVGVGKGMINGLNIAQQSAAALGPGAAFAMPIFYATQVAAVLSAASKAKSILQSGNVSGGGGGVVSSPSTSAGSTPTNTFTPPQFFNLGQHQGGNQNQNQSQSSVYVGDINRVQNRVAVTEQRATLGN